MITKRLVYVNYKSLFFCCLLIYLFLGPSLNACLLDEFDSQDNKNFITKHTPALENSKSLPKEILVEIINSLESIDKFRLRQTEKRLKIIIDTEFLTHKQININKRLSSPAIQDIKDIPFNVVSLSFKKWGENDIEQLLYFEHVTHLRLEGLNSWNFTTPKLFNPDLLSSCVSGVLSIVNMIFGMEVGTPTIFLNVTSLDLSKSSIGDYGVISFVSHFKKLQILNISNNDIGHNIIGETNAIANLNTLTSLNISKNHFSSQTVKKMSQLTNLTVLDVSYNFINDNTLIKKLSLLPKLSNFIHKNQRQQSSSNNCFPAVFYYPPILMGGRPFPPTF